jgi:putative DNA primase/helicase
MEQGKHLDKKDIIQEVKRRLSLENLLEIYNVKKGNTAKTYHCPFHEDKNPSFSITDTGWKCFTGCGSGDQISFIEKIENMNFEEALIRASSISKVSKYENIKDRAILEELKEKHLKYINSRGIKKETAKLFGLKSKKDFILFPQKREDKITGYKGINFENKKMFFEGTDKQSKLFPNYELQGIKFLIFTAGEYDCIYLTQKLLESNLNDYMVVTSSTGESSFPKDLDRLKEFSSIEKFMIFYDHDDAGKKGALKLARELSDKIKKVVEIYSFPEDKKEKYDVSDFFNEGYSVEDLLLLEKIVYEPEIQENNKNGFPFPDHILDYLDDFDFINPNEYQIDSEGVNKITITLRDEKIEKISTLPVLITKQAINTDDDIVSLELTFKRDNIWKKFVVERETICDSKKITTLCNSGFPVHSGNAKKMVEYLHAFEIANLPRMKKIYLTQNNGWKNLTGKDKNTKAFGLGKNILGLDPSENNISFSPEYGFERFTKALDSKGSFSSWITGITPLMKNDKVAFSIYASLAAPLLEIMDCSSFLVHFWGDSSMGKTTVIEIASSVWGNPAKETGGLITSWNSTMVFVERMASFFNDLPMYLDDSQTADDKTVSKIMYMIGNSTGRGRGKKAGGVDSNKSWRTVCFSTGEKQLTESTQYDGAKARTIEFNGSPFGRNEGKIVTDIKTCVRDNYGHIGKIFIEQLIKDLENPEKLEELKESYATFRELLSMRTTNEIGNRMAGYFAIIQLAGTLIEDYFKLGGNVLQTIENCFLEAINERKSEGNTSDRALDEVVSFAQANIKKFMGKSDDMVKEHYGIWRNNEYVAFFPHKLKEVLTKAGFSYNSVIRSWGDKDWIKKSKEGFTYPASYENGRYRTICINWKIFTKNLDP